MSPPNLRQHSDNAFLPRDMKCLGFDAQRNCYVFQKRNEIWLGIFGKRWDGARLVRFGRIQQSTLDEGILDDLPAVSEYPPDYAELPRPAENRLSTASTASSSSSWAPATPLGETPLTHISPTIEYAEIAAWGAPTTSITASGAPPPDHEHHLTKRALHIISSGIPHLHLSHSYQHNDRPHEHATVADERQPNLRASN